MTNTWFTSDLHLGHKNIIEYCNRPFNSLEEMDETLIANWNARVEPKDNIYVLGDFSFHYPERTYGIFRRLNGNKHLILGNHDKPKIYAPLPWCWVKDVYMLRERLGDEKVNIWLSHYAHRRWPKSHHGAYHLYGHSHGDLEGYHRSCDAGVDAWNYAPVSLQQVIDKLRDSGKTDHHKQR